jgi:glyoxylase-like metal-dependent hydrolase (beta-lactamase superfamily II)
MIEYDNTFFSGDFLFEGSIGRWDFPYSSKEDMIKSLEKVKTFTPEDHLILPGHGNSTSLEKELKGIDNWIEFVKRS